MFLCTLKKMKYHKITKAESKVKKQKAMNETSKDGSKNETFSGELFQPHSYGALQDVSSCLIHKLYQSSFSAFSAIGYLITNKQTYFSI